ncbi:MAG TPA: hypothetical protein VLY20_08170 [Nitrospiria bacterium]|nr:hypothetical protein [Nitrospiria bacterium]
MERLSMVQDPCGLEGETRPVPACLVLISTARQLTCEDLLELVETTGEYGARVHIALESWQIVVEVAAGHGQRVREAIWHLGHYCVGFLGEIDRIPAFLVSETGNKEKKSSAFVNGRHGRRGIQWVQKSDFRLNV